MLIKVASSSFELITVNHAAFAYYVSHVNIIAVESPASFDKRQGCDNRINITWQHCSATSFISRVCCINNDDIHVHTQWKQHTKKYRFPR